MKHSYYAAYRDVLIRPLLEEDTEDLRRWRNDSTLNHYLTRVGEVTVDAQRRWYEGVLEDPDQLYFSIGHGSERMIGALALYGFREDNCQIGRIIIGEPAERGKGIGRLSFLMAMAVGLRFLERERFYLYVHPDNQPALSMYRRIGFLDTGVTRSVAGVGTEREMLIDRPSLYAQNKEMSLIKTGKEEQYHA